MKLQQIEKSIYRKKLNVVSVGFIAVFALMSLIFGTLLIATFAEPILDPESQSNFRYNLLGVVLALVTMAMIANMVKGHKYLQEVYYVWQLKQIHNSIYRKLVKIKAKQIEGDYNAKIILAFYYKTLKQVYELDNNTLTISTVDMEINKLQQQLGVDEFEHCVDQFDKKLLASI